MYRIEYRCLGGWLTARPASNLTLRDAYQVAQTEANARRVATAVVRVWPGGMRRVLVVEPETETS